MRPLSQTGLHRIPKNPKQRNFEEGGLKKKRGVLDAVNERLAENGVTLHPTKGYRTLNVKRDRAQMLMAQMLQGGRVTTKQAARFLREGY